MLKVPELPNALPATFASPFDTPPSAWPNVTYVFEDSAKTKTEAPLAAVDPPLPTNCNVGYVEAVVTLPSVPLYPSDIRHSAAVVVPNVAVISKNNSEPTLHE